MEIDKFLKSIGLSDKEIIIYKNSLELGTFSIIAMSKKTGIKRPTCYVIVDSLVDRGFISKVPNSRKSLYVAEDPEIILNEQRKTLKRAESFVPELRNMKKNTSAPLVKLFHGKKGIENIYSDMLTSPDKQIYAIVCIDQIISITGKDFLSDWIQKRQEKGVHLNSLYTNQETSYKNSVEELRNVKFLPKNLDLPASFAIYGDKVAFLSSKKDDFSFIVQSEEYRDTLKNFFDYFWNKN